MCEHLEWKTASGTLKVQSCLTLLDGLEDHGVITLPPKRVTQAPVRRVPTFTEHPDSPPVEGPLASVTPMSLRLVTTPEDRARWKAYLQTYHYLGYQHPFGAHLGYLIVSEPRQQELGGFVFAASAAWALAPRDQWIGWDKKQRQKLLSLILSNDRFLTLPLGHGPQSREPRPRTGDHPHRGRLGLPARISPGPAGNLRGSHPLLRDLLSGGQLGVSGPDPRGVGGITPVTSVARPRKPSTSIRCDGIGACA